MKRENVRKSKACLKTLGKNGFRSPYQLLSDNSFIKAVNKSRITPFAFTDLFKNEPKFFMTKCTYEIHKPNLVEKDFSGSCEIIKCGHEKADVNCVYNFIKENNPHHYILATNNLFYIHKYKESKAIPILKISRCNLKIECNKLDTEIKEHVSEPASRGELKRLKKMFD